VTLYFTLLALVEYFKETTLLQTDTELCVKLIESICTVTLDKVIPQCNAETIDAAVMMLRLLVEADSSLTRHLSDIILPHVLVVYERYHKDAMLAEDIFGLITVIAQVPQNESFTRLVIPQVLNVVQRYHNLTVVQQNTAEA
jgi:hypothetical protein